MAPVASSSRRTRRRLTEDISEDPVTQRRKVEDVETDSGDDIPRHRGSRKGKKKAAVPTDRDETVINVDLDAGDVPDAPFDREAFLNQPLSQKQQSKLHLLASDATIPIEAYKQDAMEMTKRLAGHTAEFMRTDQAKVWMGTEDLEV